MVNKQLLFVLFAKAWEHCTFPDFCRSSYLTVPLNRTGSWGMIDSLLRRSANPMSLMSTPSITIEPPQHSTNRNKTTPRDDFPVDRQAETETTLKQILDPQTLPTCVQRLRLHVPRGSAYLSQCGQQCRPSLWVGWCRRSCWGPKGGSPDTSYPPPWRPAPPAGANQLEEHDFWPGPGPPGTGTEWETEWYEHTLMNYDQLGLFYI